MSLTKTTLLLLAFTTSSAFALELTGSKVITTVEVDSSSQDGQFAGPKKIDLVAPALTLKRVEQFASKIERRVIRNWMYEKKNDEAPQVTELLRTLVESNSQTLQGDFNLDQPTLVIRILVAKAISERLQSDLDRKLVRDDQLTEIRAQIRRAKRAMGFGVAAYNRLSDYNSKSTTSSAAIEEVSDAARD